MTCEPLINPSQRRYCNKTFCSLLNGPDHWPPTGGRIQCSVGCGQPRPLEGGDFMPNDKNCEHKQNRRFITWNPYKQFGLLDKMLSDWGPQFAAKAFRALMRQLGIKSVLSTAYHPQTDGTTERVNQEIEAYLAIYCHSHPKSWKEKIPTLEFTHNNNRRHAERHRTPFELMFGESPWAIPATFENIKFSSINEQLKQLVKDREEALAAHKLARMKMAERRSTYEPFKLGQKVWLDTRNIKTKYHGKMALKWEGPFEIEEVLGLHSWKETILRNAELM